MIQPNEWRVEYQVAHGPWVPIDDRTFATHEIAEDAETRFRDNWYTAKQDGVLVTDEASLERARKHVAKYDWDRFDTRIVGRSVTEWT